MLHFSLDAPGSDQCCAGSDHVQCLTPDPVGLQHGVSSGPVRWAVRLTQCAEQPFLLQPAAVNHLQQRY